MIGRDGLCTVLNLFLGCRVLLLLRYSVALFCKTCEYVNVNYVASLFRSDFVST